LFQMIISQVRLCFPTLLVPKFTCGF
jgi:hypothetical protein